MPQCADGARRHAGWQPGRRTVAWSLFYSHNTAWRARVLEARTEMRKPKINMSTTPKMDSPRAIWMRYTSNDGARHVRSIIPFDKDYDAAQRCVEARGKKLAKLNKSPRNSTGRTASKVDWIEV